MADGSQKILVVDPFLPMPDRSAGGLRLYRLLEMLISDGHEVTFLARSNWRQDEYVPALEAMGLTVIAGDPQRGPNRGGKSRTPALAFEALMRRGRFDTAIIESFECAQLYLPSIRHCSPSTRVIVDTIDLHFLREQRAAEVSGDAHDAAKAANTRQAEMAIYSAADGLIAISDVEAEVLRQELPNTPVFTITIIHQLAKGSTPSFAARRGLVFVGNFWHPPNAEGLLWFCETVVPLVRQELGPVIVNVIGQNPPPALQALVNLGVKLHGWVPDTAPFLNNSRLSIAPLLHGAGQKGKVGEALSAGLPVVTTDIGAEGMGLTNGYDVLVANSPQAFAAAVVRAYQDEQLWTSLADNGRRLISQRYTPEAVLASVRRVIPPSADAKQHYLTVPDWSDLGALVQALIDYVYRHEGSSTSRFEIAVIDDVISVEKAFATLVRLLNTAGLDPETIPDVAITPMSAAALADVPADLMWVPTSSVAAPSHLQSALVPLA